MDRARVDRLYTKLEKAGLFDEVNVLLWNKVTNASRGAYEEGKADGYRKGHRDGVVAGYKECAKED